MAQNTPQYIYVHGCPGFYNLSICSALSKLLVDSKVFKIETHARHRPGHGQPRTSSSPETQSNEKFFTFDSLATSEETRNKTLIFSDFRGSSVDSIMPVEHYEIAAEKRGVPFFHIVLRCHSKNYVRDTSAVRKSHWKKEDAFDFQIFESIWRTEEICTLGGPNELELEIAGMGPSEAAEEIFEHVSRCRAAFMPTNALL